jgi:hypothetical protein
MWLSTVVLKPRVEMHTEAHIFQQQTNSVVLVRKRTIPIERPPLVGEVSANFIGDMVSRGQRNESPRPLISVF